MSTFQRAKNHWEAEELAGKEYFKKYLALPVNVESRKIGALDISRGPICS